MNDPDCYGKFPNGNTPCAKCDYFDSCRYYAATAKAVNCRERHMASFERASFLVPEMPDFDHIPGEEKSTETENIVEALSKFFRYLIDLDEYTLALICQTVSGDENHQPVTVNSLSSLLGCSRQAVHRKMLSVIAAHPELSGFFRRVITKFAAAKSLTWRRKKDGGESCSVTPRSSAKL
ncbi:MAG: hypothetical protein E7053_00260 [Lentisphaerae bacterium]|nr:hypothetical protein [Lentisphaerota bacterium]